ncbi:DUF7511 domain-containing protein [Halosolutus gelatinilyticus]|uniref:DUF7511 domain-containing protein n=1 Tax=Halosolutus gelatinilyticus TaxID=2931975 RepID=UPI001FF367B1|nr:hypothetical protein [Halosolutus gelatinilyticus]
MSEADPEDVEQAIEEIESDFEWVETHADALRSGLEHTIIRNGDEPDECAIYPRYDEVFTEWISATGEESFVDLLEVR